MRKSTLAAQLMRSTVLTGAAVAMAAPAFAQEEDEIVVTGSRIARQDLAAPSPVTTVDAQQLVLTNTVNTEQFLNTLPQVIPAFDSTSNNPGNGTATVNLRGIGTARTLVLVDGSRFPPADPFGVTDLNNIPAAIVQRIDVVTGGASAVYGSDAVAGVVNFILKDDFEGVQLDVSNELSAAGWDANIFNGALTLGGNFADGRGNAILSLSYTNREPLLQGERDFSSNTIVDFSAPGVPVFGGSGSVQGGQFIELGAGSFAAFYPAPVVPAGQTVTNNITFNGAPDGRRFVSPQDQYNYAPVNYLQLPQERYSIYAGGTYEINDNVEFYARGVFASSVVDQQLAPTPVGGTFNLNLDNPNLSPVFLAALQGIYTGPTDVQDRDGDGEVDDIRIFIARRFDDTSIGNRNSLRDSSTFQIKGGLRGDLGDNWNWDVFGQFSRVSTTQTQTGNISFSALQDGILDGSVNVFGINTIDEAGGEAIRRTGIIGENVEQIQIVGTLSGVIDQIKSPFADSGVGLAVGVEYREEEALSQPDSVLGPDVRGFNASLPVGGSFDVYEAFMEADIPLIENSAIGDVGINGAFRYSDYSTTNVGSTISFAAGVEWAPIDGLRFRGQFQRAVRAPNIGELFAAATNGFPGAKDPCSSGNGNYDELTDGNPANGEAPIATLNANCAANGVPVPGAAFQISGQIEVLGGGNPNLQEETADTYTVGMVWQPTFVEGLTLQVDYYDISVKDAIAAAGALQTLLDRCYILGDAATCSTFFGAGTRDPATGAIGAPFLPVIAQANVASIGARGIDFTLGYNFDIGSLGTIDTRYYGNYTLESSFLPDAFATVIECAGEFGSVCGEPTPEYKHTMQTSWLYGALTSSVRWRYIGGVVVDEAGGGPFSSEIGAANYVDVTLQYAVNENLDLTVGVQNILANDPPLLASTVNEQANTYPATYETLGRQLFFGASLKF